MQAGCFRLTLRLADAFGLLEEDLPDSEVVEQNARQRHALLFPVGKMDVAFADFITGRAGGLKVTLKVRECKRFGRTATWCLVKAAQILV